MPVVSACEKCSKEFLHAPKRKRVFCGRECQGEASRRYEFLGSDPETYGFLASYKSAAASRGLEWKLDDDFVVGLLRSACYLCGAKPASGIDRIDSSKGYEEGNAVPCCADCNYLKNALSFRDFLTLVKRVYRYAENQGYYWRDDLVESEEEPRKQFPLPAP